jgi:hypothetical protein
LRADDHLAACEACRHRLDKAERVAAGVTALRESFQVDAALEHPAHDQITAYVDGTSNEIDREVIEAHVETCRTCAEDVEDLRSVRSSVSTVVPIRSRKRLWYATAGLAAAAALAAILVWTGRNPAQPNIDAGRNRAAESTASPGTTATPPIVVALKDGSGTITLDASGVLAGIPALTSDDRDLIVAALRTGRVEIPSTIVTLRGRPGVLLGPPGSASSLRPLRPVATAVESVRPVFEWTALPGATSYVVSVFDTDLDKIAESEPLSTMQWTPTQQLTRGRVYTWQIRARTAAGEVVSPRPPAPEARFRVLAQTEADRVAALRKDYGGSPLALGVLLAHAGLLDEAERPLEDIVAANPSSREAQELLASVRDMRRPQ